MNIGLLYGVSLLLKNSGGDLQGVKLPIELHEFFEYGEISDSVKVFYIRLLRDGFSVNFDRASVGNQTRSLSHLYTPNDVPASQGFFKERDLHWGLDEMPIDMAKKLLPLEGEGSQLQFSWLLDKELLKIRVESDEGDVLVTINTETKEINIHEQGNQSPNDYFNFYYMNM